ncbi:MAG: nitrilase-related carbon-nitrogen hydrolase [Hyphomonadaceae bacterium]
MLLLGRIVAALISGALLAQAYSLNPFWPLAWLAPIPLLIAAIGATRLGAFAYGAIAGAVSMVLMVGYFMQFGGIVPVLIIMLIKALIWGAMAYAVRGAARLLPKWVAVFVFPSLMAGIDTLIAATSPHGSAGSLAYSQMDFLPVIQIASLGGAPAITFVVSLFASAVAILITKRALISTIAPTALIVGALVFGLTRVPVVEPEVPSGPPRTLNATLIAGDQFEGIPMDWRAVWNGYTPQIERAADEGRRIVVLPEKIALLPEDERAVAIEQLAEIARRRDILIVAGADDEDERGRFNRAFAFAREAWDKYDKRHMIPGFESHFAPGSGPLIFEHEGVRYGVAICKDMDFPALGREYAGVAIMLVPAWDFTDDAWLHSRMAMLRGVESGYAIARSARNGALTVSDAYGRVSHEAPSGPQTAYSVTIPRTGPGPTLYARFGDAFGWSTLALAALLIGWTILRRRRVGGAD